MHVPNYNPAHCEIVPCGTILKYLDMQGSKNLEHYYYIEPGGER